MSQPTQEGRRCSDVLSPSESSDTSPSKRKRKLDAIVTQSQSKKRNVCEMSSSDDDSDVACQEWKNSKVSASSSAIDQIRDARNKMARALKQKDDNADVDNNHDLGLEHLTRVCSALVTTNQDIWDGCLKKVKVVRSHQSFLRSMKEREVGQTSVGFVSSGLREGELVLKRKAYSLIKVSEGHCFEHHFQAVLVPQEKIFALPSLPDPIKNFIRPECTRHCFIDYGELLDKAMCLHDSVLKRYLLCLKKHLEQVQVCLGEIDAWTIFAVECVVHLEAVFDEDFPVLHRRPMIDEHAIHAVIFSSFMMRRGSVSMDFDLEKEGDREKLQKFVDFAKMFKR